MGIRNMQGVSAHLEYVGPKGRKRKKSCVYYNDGICHCTKSNYYLLKCGGRCACSYYDDSEEVKEYYYNYLGEIINIDNKVTKHKSNKKRNENIIKNCSTEKHMENKNIKIEDIVTKKKYLVQLVSKDKENEKACIFYIKSEIGKLFAKCKVGDYVEFVMNGDNHKFKVKEIKQV